MRFLYGTILGVLATIVAGILYLALAGGQHLLVLSPTYHDMRAQLEVLRTAERQRDQLAQKLEDLEKRFVALGERFNELSEASGAASPEAAPREGQEPPSAP